jgi:hypothetical protein
MIAYVVINEDGDNYGPFHSLDRAILLTHDIMDDGLICEIVEVELNDNY